MSKSLFADRRTRISWFQGVYYFVTGVWPVAAYRRTRTVEIGLLAVASATGLTAIDVVYVARRVILPIYLLDAVIEVPLIVAWCTALAIGRSQRHRMAS